MFWIISLAIVGFLFWLTRRAHKRNVELEPTGILRSPLYWTRHALSLLLIAFPLYMAQHRPIPAFMWLGLLAIIIALFFVRRSLKWRYPI